jgi:two-component system sensor histidine kinase DevS
MSAVPLTREQLEERLAALHRASLELVREISLESLLERLAHMACEQVGARFAAVGVVNDRGEVEQFIPVGMSEFEIANMDHPPRGLGLIGALMRSKYPIRIADIGADPRSVGFPTDHPEMTSFLGVPIRQGDVQLGQIYLTNKINAPEFSKDDELVIEMLAAYAATAISNANMYRKLIERDRSLTQRNESLALVNSLASTLSSATGVAEILEYTLDRLIDYLHIEVLEVYLREEDGQVLRLSNHEGNLVKALWASSRLMPGEGLLGEVILSGQPIIFNPLENAVEELHPDVLIRGFKQVACFPLMGGGGALGVLCAATCYRRLPDQTDLQLISSLSAWLGTVIENVRLNVQQRRLAVLEERERIGMDLHDGVIQSIYAVGLTLEHARLLLQDTPEQARQRINQAVEDLNSTIRDIRSYILDLRPRQLGNENLLDGIKRLVKEFHTNTLVEVHLDGKSQDVAVLPHQQAVALFHICQEGLANIAKHARARNVEVALWATNGRALLEIHDDGRGFVPEKARLSLGHGLSNMYTRARNAGGEVEISSEVGEGTTILAWVPL